MTPPRITHTLLLTWLVATFVLSFSPPPLVNIVVALIGSVAFVVFWGWIILNMMKYGLKDGLKRAFLSK